MHTTSLVINRGCSYRRLGFRRFDGSLGHWIEHSCVDSVFAIVFGCFSPITILLGQTEMRTRGRKAWQSIRTVWDISQDDRARIATTSLRMLTDKQTYIKENYNYRWRECNEFIRKQHASMWLQWVWFNYTCMIFIPCGPDTVCGTGRSAAKRIAARRAAAQRTRLKGTRLIGMRLNGMKSCRTRLFRGAPSRWNKIRRCTTLPVSVKPTIIFSRGPANVYNQESIMNVFMLELTNTAHNQRIIYNISIALTSQHKFTGCTGRL